MEKLSQEKIDIFKEIFNLLNEYAALFVKVNCPEGSEFLHIEIENGLLIIEYKEYKNIIGEITVPCIQKIYFNIDIVLSDYEKSIVELKEKEIEKGRTE